MFKSSLKKKLPPTVKKRNFEHMCVFDVFCYKIKKTTTKSKQFMFYKEIDFAITKN